MKMVSWEHYIGDAEQSGMCANRARSIEHILRSVLVVGCPMLKEGTDTLLRILASG